jgi:hypothetical protein
VPPPEESSPGAASTEPPPAASSPLLLPLLLLELELLEPLEDPPLDEELLPVIPPEPPGHVAPLPASEQPTPVLAAAARTQDTQVTRLRKRKANLLLRALSPSLTREDPPARGFILASFGFAASSRDDADEFLFYKITA